MVSLQYAFGIAASQTFVAVTLAEFFELRDGKVPATGEPRSPSLAVIVGFGRPDFFGVTLGPVLAAGDYFFALTFVVRELRSSYFLPVFRCPSSLVLGNLLFVFFLVLSTSFDPMGQVRPGFRILSVLLQVFTPVLLSACSDADFALLPPASVIELRELFRQTTPFTCFVTQTSIRMVYPRSLLH